jgi:WD40 repeat protein
VRVLRGHKGRVCALAYAPDGRTLASGGNDRRVRLWDAATGSERLALQGHPACVYALAFSPDGRSQARAVRSAGWMTFGALTREEYRSDKGVNKGP